MKTIKVSEATPIQLDWLVAKAQGWVDYPEDSIEQGEVWYIEPDKAPFGRILNKSWFRPATNWAQGGPIIEREHLSIEAYSAPNDEGIACFWFASEDKFDAETWDAPTPLIAAMRCYVASKLGDEVEIPEELT